MMDLYILSDPVTNFWKVAKKFFFFFFFFGIFIKVGGLIGYIKTQLKNLEFGMDVNWHK